MGGYLPTRVVCSDRGWEVTYPGVNRILRPMWDHERIEERIRVYLDLMVRVEVGLVHVHHNLMKIDSSETSSTEETDLTRKCGSQRNPVDDEQKVLSEGQSNDPPNGEEVRVEAGL